MINAPHDKEFVFHDGSRAKNLSELVLKIENLNDHEFHQFVNQHKNDFANWIEHVLTDKHLAERLRTILSRHETVLLIKDRIHDITLGNSIIKIPKIEDHSEYHTRSAEHKEHHELHLLSNKVENHEPSHEAREEHTQKDYVNKTDHVHPGHQKTESHEIHLKEDHKVHDKHEEKRDELKAKHNWFQLFSKKKLSEDNLIKIEREEEDKLSAERELQEEMDSSGRENALWVILYFALVLLIITLLIYKLFMQ